MTGVAVVARASRPSVDSRLLSGCYVEDCKVMYHHGLGGGGMTPMSDPRGVEVASLRTTSRVMRLTFVPRHRTLTERELVTGFTWAWPRWAQSSMVSKSVGRWAAPSLAGIIGRG